MDGEGKIHSEKIVTGKEVRYGMTVDMPQEQACRIFVDIIQQIFERFLDLSRLFLLNRPFQRNELLELSILYQLALVGGIWICSGRLPQDV